MRVLTLAFVLLILAGCYRPEYEGLELLDDPPALFERWHAEVAECIGWSEPYYRIEWRTADVIDPMDHQGLWRRPHRITLDPGYVDALVALPTHPETAAEWAQDQIMAQTAKHHIIHDVLQSSDHDHWPFAECQLGDWRDRVDE